MVAWNTDRVPAPLQPEGGGAMSEVIALWQDLTCSGPHNVVWVLAPRRPLSAWVAMSGSRQATAGSSFAVSSKVLDTARQTGLKQIFQ